ncbi:phage tail protein, partial [Escherichia coli]
DSEFASEISGYPSGAMLISDDGERIFINTTEGNLSDPNSNGTGWKDILSYLGLGEAAKMSAAALVINGNTLTAKIPVVINGVNMEFIIQASQISSSARNGVITFPSAFPNACIAIFAHDFATASTDLSNVRFYIPGRTSASWIGQNMSTGSESSPATWCWLAIGW